MSKEDLEFLIDLQERMNKQDESSASCDFQASPYFWGVAENKIEWGIDADYCSDEVCYCYDGEEYNSIEECKELFKDLIDKEEDDYETQLKEIENISDWCDIDNYNDENDVDGNIVYGRKVEDVISKYTGCFLTKQACKEHIEKYGYNYSEPHTFAMTADRNPEFERVWNILKKTDWKQIADLEAKLAESESKVAVGRFWHSAYEGKQLDYDKLNNDYNKQEKLLSEVLADKSKLQFEFDQLKQQLAEKNKEIENIKLCRCVNCKNEYEFMLEGLVDDLEKQIDKDGQDKISFAVEQLEKVKNGIESKVESIYKRLDDLNIKIVCESTSRQLDSYEEIVKEIDNQIEELKKEMK